MLAVAEDRAPTADIGCPYLHCVIPAGRGEVLATGRPRHTAYKTRMPTIGENGLPTAGVPYPHRLIPTGRGEVFAIGRPRHAQHGTDMPIVNENGLPTVGVPHPHRL